MVTAELVRQLRERTGAGMMDCKKALNETNGDMDKAIEFLREKGLAAAAKKSGRVAAEGIVESYIHDAGNVAVLVEVNIETDFAAKNEEFKQLVKDVAVQIAEKAPKFVKREDAPAGDNGEGLLEQAWTKNPSMTIQQLLTEKVATIGENISIRRFVRFQKDSSVMEAYVHGDGRIGVVVEIAVENDSVANNEEFKAFAKDLALQVAASKPEFVRREEVPTDVIEKEKEILKAQALNEGKPANIVEKMVV